MKQGEMVRRLTIWGLVAVILLMPGMAWAQSIDPAVRNVIGRGVNATAPRALGVAGGSAAVIEVPQTGFLLPTPTPEPATPGEPTSYSQAGVSFDVPAEWEVDPSPYDDELYVEVSPYRGDLKAVLLSSPDDFPGLLGVTLVRALAEELVGTFMDDVELLGVDVIVTDQGVPVVSLRFTGEEFGEASTGMMLVYGPGDTAVMVMAFGPDEDWDEFGDGFLSIAESVRFDEELLTFFTAEVDSYYADREDTIETLVPAGWYASAGIDDMMRIALAEPDLTYAVVLGRAIDFSPDLELDAEDLALLVQAGNDTELGREVMAAILEELGGGGDSMMLDESLTTLTPTAEGAIVRIVGSGPLDDETEVPIGVYLDLRPSGSVAMIVLGALDRFLADEELLLEILVETLVLD